LCQVSSRGDLSPEEKRVRREQTQHKHYEANKEKILEKAREKRDLTLSIFAGAQKVSEWGKKEIEWKAAFRDHFTSTSKKHRDVYGQASQFHLDAFLKTHVNPVDFSTFPIFVVYFLPRTAYPDPTQAPANPNNKLIDFLLAESHWRQLSPKIHPDKAGLYGKYAADFNAGWQLWQPIFANPSLKDAPIPPNPTTQPDAYAEYCTRRPEFAVYSAIYWAFTCEFCNMSQALQPPSLTTEAVYQHLLDREESVKLLNDSLDEHEGNLRDFEEGILEAIQLTLKASTFTKARRKRKASPSPEEEDEEDDVEVEVEDVDNDTIDPNLLPSTRSRRTRSRA
jgi:hypothetical protein